MFQFPNKLKATALCLDEKHFHFVLMKRVSFLWDAGIRDERRFNMHALLRLSDNDFRFVDPILVDLTLDKQWLDVVLIEVLFSRCWNCRNRVLRIAHFIQQFQFTEFTAQSSLAQLFNFYFVYFIFLKIHSDRVSFNFFTTFPEFLVLSVIKLLPSQYYKMLVLE